MAGKTVSNIVSTIAGAIGTVTAATVVVAGFNAKSLQSFRKDAGDLIPMLVRLKKEVVALAF